ncbi:MAG: ABC transporter ATP-binding protein [bacterium]|nr:ABC transporter ATP-binding protein [bacterium]
MENAIEIKALKKIYRDFWNRPKVTAVNGLDLTVKKGEIFGMLGPNGSGKTTVLKLLLGLIFPSSGSIKVMGASPENIGNKKNIGYMPEESYLYGFLNADEILDFYGKLNAMPEKIRKKRINEVLDIVGLSEARKRRVADYSKGMSRRIGLAQVLLKDPDLVLLDEPTIGLDPIGAGEIKNIIKKLKDRGKTVLLSSHLLAEVQTICDRIAILYNGKLVREGNVDDLLTEGNKTEIIVSGLKTGDIDKIKELISGSGGDLISVDHPSETLESLFIKLIREKSGKNN